MAKRAGTYYSGYETTADRFSNILIEELLRLLARLDGYLNSTSFLSQLWQLKSDRILCSIAVFDVISLELRQTKWLTFLADEVEQDNIEC